MKSRRVLAALVMVSALLLTGCGNGEENQESTQNQVGQEQQESTYLKDMDVDQYVTLGDYKNIQVDLEKAVLTEEEITWELLYNLADVVTVDFGAVMDRPVENGDLINLDYAGYQDGEAFEGGSATDQFLGIGSNQFIDGFEEGLVGVKPGETVELNLTFPEKYHSADMAGADVVFTVTVNYIIPNEAEVGADVIEALEIEGVTDAEQLRAHVTEYLQAYVDEDYQTNFENLVLQNFIEDCTFNELPAARAEADKAQTRANLEAQATAYGVDADTLVQYLYGVADAETFINSYSESATQQLIAIQAVANKEGLGITDEELDSMLMEYATSAGFDTVEEYCGDTDKETFREFFLYDKVLNFLIENASITK